MRNGRTILRLLYAYLLGCLAATLGFLAVMLVYSIRYHYAREYLGDLSAVSLMLGAYSLGYTLILGAVGWSLLSLLGLRHRVFYAIGGALLGALTAGLTMGFHSRNPYFVAFTVCGACAALAFHLSYFRSPPGSPPISTL